MKKNEITTIPLSCIQVGFVSGGMCYCNGGVSIPMYGQPNFISTRAACIVHCCDFHHAETWAVEDGMSGEGGPCPTGG